MQRFRRKSDAKPRSPAPVPDRDKAFRVPSPALPSPNPSLLLPSLPGPSDFRTSLILPSLERRFTLLRSFNGDPVPLEDMKNKFALQRAMGAEYQLSEEEEQQVLNQLQRIRDENNMSPPTNPLPSPSSPATPANYSLPSNSPSKPSKYYANSLFSSSQSSDAHILRKMTRNGSDRSVLSKLSGDSLLKHVDPPILPNVSHTHPLHDENAKDAQSAGYISDKTPLARQLNLQPTTSPPPTLTRHERKASRVDQARISMALSNVMKEIEEEGILDSDALAGLAGFRSQELHPQMSPQDQIMTGLFRASSKRVSNTSKTSYVVDGGDDGMRSPSPYARSSAASPTPRIPGYIPGMPRPLTPKSPEVEDPSRPRSTTPRAYSPSSERPLPPSILRRGSLSNNTRALPRSDSPVYSGIAGTKKKLELSHSRSNSPIILDRHHPLSPLSSPRPELHDSKVSPIHNGERTIPGMHNKGDSLSSGNEFTGFHHRERSYSSVQSTIAPALPDSPLLDSMHRIGITPSPLETPLIPSPDATVKQTIDFVLSKPSHGRIRSTDSGANHTPSPLRLDPGESNSGSHSLSSWQNSSQVSLISTGSSYHSVRDAARQASDAAFSLISQPTTPATSEERDGQLAEYEPGSSAASPSMKVEEALQFFGLTEENIAAMQETLVQLASPDLVLVPQTLTLRRRKNSIPSRATSPIQLKLNEKVPNHTNEESQVKLLNSMLHSIESTITDGSPPSPQQGPDVSNAIDSYVDVGRSASALAGLADALFGASQSERDSKDQQDSKTMSLGQISPQSLESDTQLRQQAGSPNQHSSLTSTSDQFSGSEEPSGWGRIEDSQSNNVVHVDGLPSAPLSPSPTRVMDEVSPHILVNDSPVPSRSGHDTEKLLKDIARRADEATKALKSPSQIKLDEQSESPRRRPIKRSTLGPIGSPQLISSSSRINTFTIYSSSSNNLSIPEQRSPSKLSQQMKKIKGSFRGAKTPNGDEVTPWTYDPSSHSQDEQLPSSLDASFTSSSSLPFHSHSSDQSKRPGTPSTSSPMSPGPSIKSFLGRFRKSKREPDEGKDRSPQPSPLGQVEFSSLNRSKSNASTTLTREPSSSSSAFLHRRLNQNSVLQSTSLQSSVSSPQDVLQLSEPAPENDDLKKLFAAATNLGLDRDELNKLLSRSTSISKPADSYPTSHPRSPSDATTPTAMTHNLVDDQVSLSRSSTAQTRGGRGHRRNLSSIDFGQSQDESSVFDTDQTITAKRSRNTKRRSSIKKPVQVQPVQTKRTTNDLDNFDGSIVRRTIIIPSDADDSAALTELEGLLRRNSKTRKRTSSGTGKPPRDIHDRVPTPPPSRARRFSSGKSSPIPPIPGITTTLASPTLSTFSGISKASGSQRGRYDSFYDMYDETDTHELDSNLGTRPSLSRDSVPAGPALQLLELANGETIWSIVNDLRSLPGDDPANWDRQSFVSEYSRPSSPSYEDTMQLRFKEHLRQTSKSSANSFLTSINRKRVNASNTTRPETKVFFSTTTQIGRLIDSLSKGLDAGSFNIVPIEGANASGNGTGKQSLDSHLDGAGVLRGESPRPTSSVQSEMSVDAQLEHMLGALRGLGRTPLAPKP